MGLLAVTWFWDAIAVWPWLTLCFMFLVGVGTGNFSGYGPIFTELFPTQVRSTAMGTAFNLARGILLAAFFAIFTGARIWLLPETRGTRVTAAEIIPESP